jgi:hypothetical protein
MTNKQMAFDLMPLDRRHEKIELRAQTSRRLIRKHHDGRAQGKALAQRIAP